MKGINIEKAKSLLGLEDITGLVVSPGRWLTARFFNNLQSTTVNFDNWDQLSDYIKDLCK